MAKWFYKQLGQKENFHTNQPLRLEDNLNRWSHVVTTDIESGIITHYVNGRSFSREKLVENIVLNFPKALMVTLFFRWD